MEGVLLMEKSMIYLEGRRDMYLEIRCLVTDEVLKRAEIDIAVTLKPIETKIKKKDKS